MKDRKGGKSFAKAPPLLIQHNTGPDHSDAHPRRTQLSGRHSTHVGFRDSDAEELPRQPGTPFASAVAYNALLSIVPLLILIVIALSHIIVEAELLHTLGRYM